MSTKPQVGEERGEVLSFIWNLNIQQSAEAELDENVINRAAEIAKEKAGNEHFSDSPKFSVTKIIIKNGYVGTIWICPGYRYSHVLASREQEFNPLSDPIESIYKKELEKDIFTKKDARFVNVLTQGALIAVNPKGKSTDTADLPVIITIRNEVDSGKGLRHHIAGYTDLPSGFEDYNFTASAAFNHMYNELFEEVGIASMDLVTGLQPLAITQNHLEPQVCYLGITQLSKDEIMERQKNARDNWEGDLEFVPLKELEQYAKANNFYSHSRPICKDYTDKVFERFDRMRGAKGTTTL